MCGRKNRGGGSGLVTVTDGVMTTYAAGRTGEGVGIGGSGLVTVIDGGMTTCAAGRTRMGSGPITVTDGGFTTCEGEWGGGVRPGHGH